MPINWTNQTEAKLTVNGTPVDLSTPYITLTKLNVAYTGKDLAFTEISTQGHGHPTWDNEHTVKLEMDLDGAGLKTYFQGRIKKRQHVGRNHAEGIEYVAFGNQNLANEISLIGLQALPEDFFALGTHHVSSALREMFFANNTELGSCGIPATIGVPGSDVFQTVLDNDVDLKNTNFVDGVNQVIQQEPAKRVFWDDITSTWIFPDLFNSPAYDLGIGTADFEEHTFTLDTMNRYTAVQIWEPYQTRLGVEAGQTIDLTPGWNVQFEADWDIKKAIGKTAPADIASVYSLVFRYWTFSGSGITGAGDLPVMLMVLSDYWDRPTWIPVMANINWDTQEVMANVPVVVKGNPHAPGDAVGPLAAKLLYWKLSTFTIGNIRSLRVPTSGYTGTANSLFGVQKTKKLMVDSEHFDVNWAAANLEVLKDVIISGDVPVWGDPLKDFINLQAIVTVSHPTNTTGMENLFAAVMKYSYDFGDPGKNTLTLSTDKTNLINLD